MNRPVSWRIDSRRSAYTLIEILVATTLSLLLMAAVVEMFGRVGEGISNSRSMLEAADRLRVVQARLQQDLAGVTVTMNPPCRPEDNAGYFEYIEGPVTQETASNYAVDSENDATTSPGDSTVGDFDDILMFTTRSTGRPFIGRYNGNSVIQSDVAEVAWFLRGRTLHRRVLLVAPTAFAAYPAFPAAAGFYTGNDISAHLATINGVNVGVPNTLADLTRRECRYAHQTNTSPFPYSVSNNWFWRWHSTATDAVDFPTLPTLNECSATAGWVLGQAVASGPIYDFDQTLTPPIPLDFWSNNPTYQVAENVMLSGVNGTRIADDVILTNVIGFDVRAWDPEAPVMRNATGDLLFPGMTSYDPAVGTVATRGAYVDLGYWPGSTTYVSRFASNGLPVDRVNTVYLPKVYDTWSTSYESTFGGALAGRAVNGFDDNGDGVVDNDIEKLTSPPYPVPLRGIQVKIRTFEPDSRQIREVTIVQDFLPQ